MPLLLKCPPEVLALHAVAGEESDSARWDVARVHIGRDKDGPWAAATDTRIGVLLRWDGDEQDFPEIGIAAAAVADLARVGKKWTGFTVSVEPGSQMVSLYPDGVRAMHSFNTLSREGKFPPIRNLVADATKGDSVVDSPDTMFSATIMSRAMEVLKVLRPSGQGVADAVLRLHSRNTIGPTVIEAARPYDHPRPMRAWIVVMPLSGGDFPTADPNVSDASLPVTRNWLRFLGSKPAPSDMGESYPAHEVIAGVRFWEFDKTHWLMDEADRYPIRSRGQMRALLAGLGVDLGTMTVGTR